ncbi:MAG: hypothetical protein WCE20_08840 [Rhizomicrobium sp.]
MCRTGIRKIVGWSTECKLDIDSQITRTMGIADINHAFDLMHEGKSTTRSVVVY